MKASIEGCEKVNSPERHTRLPGLDGLRGLAVMGVVLYHLGWAQSGYLGVDCFFVLSGFLITGILQVELQRSGSIKLLRFTYRRLLRLYPALLVLAFAVCMVAVVTKRSVLGTFQDAGAALTYTANLVQLHGTLDHTWTLALEAQFYLVWPGLLLLSHRSRVGLWPSVTLVLLLLAADLIYGQKGFLHSYVRAMGLPLGCALSLVAPRITGIWRLGRWTTAAVLVVLFVPLPSWSTTGWPISVGALLTAPSVIWLCQPGAQLGLLKNPVVQWLGLRSYSLYLWHFPICSALQNHSLASVPHSIVGIGGLALSLLISEVSFRMVEQPVLRWRDRPKQLR